MVSKSKTGLFALGFFVFASFFTILAFVSPYWLVTDGKLKNPKFIQIGLWLVCFNGFEEVHHWYDTVFTGCWWIFEEEYYIIHDTLLPGFFIATQFFFTISLCCVLVSIFLTYLYFRKDKDDDNYLTLLVTLGTILVIGGLLLMLSPLICQCLGLFESAGFAQGAGYAGHLGADLIASNLRKARLESIVKLTAQLLVLKM